MNSVNSEEINSLSIMRKNNKRRHTQHVPLTSHNFRVYTALCRKSFPFNNLGCRLICELNIKKV